MQALFVHGMGRSPLSGWRLLRQLKRAGIKPMSFGYSVSFESFEKIKRRLISKIQDTAKRGDYILIGHSLGGVLLRAALAELSRATRQPRHVFLLGSPVQASRLAQRLKNNMLYRLVTRDCGQLLACAKRMSEVGQVVAPTTAIIGVRGLANKKSPFKGEPNDGIVALAEASAPWLSAQIQIPVMHTLLPASRLAGEIILKTLA